MAHLRQIIEKEAQAAGGNLRSAYRSVGHRVDKNPEYIYQLYQRKPKANGATRAVSLELSKALDRHYAEGRAPGWINLPPVEGSETREAQADTSTNAGAPVAPIATWPFKAVSYRRFMALPREARAEIDTYLDSMVLTWERKSATTAVKRKRS